MANAVVYVDTNAVGANNGTSWANAYTTLAAAITASGTTGTDFYVSSLYSQTAAGITLAFKGVAATPDRVFSTGTTNSPPTTADLAFGAGFSTTTNTAITITGYVYIYGVQFSPGSGNNAAAFTLGNNVAGDITLDQCFYLQNANNASTISVGANNNVACRVTWIGTAISFKNAGSTIFGIGGIFRWLDTASAVGGTLPTTLFATNSGKRPTLYQISGVDLSGLSNKALTGAMVCLDTFQFFDCKLGSGFTVGTPAVPGVTVDLINCDSGSTTYKQQRNAYQGTLTASTSVYNNATDGTTPISWQVITTANANPQSPFECFDIVQWVATGTYAASKIFATSATASLKTNDIWVDVEYLGSIYPSSTPATTLGAGSGTTTLPQIPQGTTPGSITSGASWGTGGLGNNYSLDIPSFTTSAAGYVRFRVKVAKATLTINIDPAVTVA